MKRKNKLPELLAPAGNMDALYAAILGGADAVYVGGERFGARAYAKNFSLDELRSAVKICHIHGVKIYVTLNTLIYDKEINDALSYAKELGKIGVDAVIIADVGVASLIKKEIPELELHASTQMGAHNTAGVDFSASLGCSRAVIARECSLSDMRKIVENSSLECEVFLHGALCVCHSGQCLFSSMVGGRSGNRGECAQPCRLPYNNGKYPLSLSDLSLANHINELIDSGVASLKIEGRMKSPEYVFKVTSVYRKLLDESRCANQEENKSLKDVFSRGGFTDGYFTGKIFAKMTGIRSEDDKRISRETETQKIVLPKLRVKAMGVFKRGANSSLSLTAEIFERGSGRISKIIASAKGPVPEEAENAPLTKDGLKARLSKMGNTPFSVSDEDIEILLDEGLNLSPSLINALRRDASFALEEMFSKTLDALMQKEDTFKPRGNLDTCFEANCERVKSTALFFDYNKLEEVNKKSPELLSGIDVLFVPLFDYEKMSERLKEVVTGVYLPPVVMEREWDEVLLKMKESKLLGAKYALLGNISHLSLVSAANLIPVGDFRLNVTNKYSREFYNSCGIKNIILSPELTLPQARDIGGAVITMGRIPLMITERCFTKENFGCENCSKAQFTDRKGAKFPIMREYNHRNVIFNSSVTYMGDKKEELKASKISAVHFILSSEKFAECAELLRSYAQGVSLNVPHRRIGKR